MTLNKTNLQDPFTDLFEGDDGFPSSEAEAATAIATAYRTYAAAAAAASTKPPTPLLTAAGNTLASALAAAFTSAKSAGPSGVAALGLAMDTAFVAFWLAPPVAFAFPVPGTPTMAGVVTLAPPGVLAPALIALFTSGVAQSPSAAQQAQALATILDGWTRTVMVVNTPITPPGPPAPSVPLI